VVYTWNDFPARGDEMDIVTIDEVYQNMNDIAAYVGEANVANPTNQYDEIKAAQMEAIRDRIDLLDDRNICQNHCGAEHDTYLNSHDLSQLNSHDETFHITLHSNYLNDDHGTYESAHYPGNHDSHKGTYDNNYHNGYDSSLNSSDYGTKCGSH